MEHDKIKDSLKKLNDSPLFALSLGSKELFHSNFLYFISTIEKIGCRKESGKDQKEISGSQLFTEIIEKTSGIILPQKGWKVEREKFHMDLTVWENPSKGNEKCLLVIENKIKSIPSFSQIKEYQDKFKKQGELPPFILLTMLETFPDRTKIEKELGCKIVSYKNLSECIKYCISIVDFENQYYAALFEDYISFIEGLSYFCSEEKDPLNKSLMLKYDEKLDNLRILELVQAARINEIYSQVKKELDKNTEKYKDIKLFTSYGRNGGQFLEVAYVPNVTGRDEETGKEIEGEEPTHYSLGIQAQGHQYAHFICPLSDSQKEKATAQKFKGHFADSNSEFQELMKKRNFKTKSRLRNLPFRSFGGFSFQTVEIPDDATYGFVVSQIMDDLNVLVDNFKESDLEIKKEI